MPKIVPPRTAEVGTQPKVKTPGKPGRKSRHVGPQLPKEIPLSLDERTELRGIFENSTYKKAFANARLRKPPCLINGLYTALGGQIATTQLARIQGWEMFEAALAQQTMDPVQKPEPLQEDFADPLLPPIK